MREIKTLCFMWTLCLISTRVIDIKNIQSIEKITFFLLWSVSMEQSSCYGRNAFLGVTLSSIRLNVFCFLHTDTAHEAH